MIRTIKRLTAVAAFLVVAATVYAIADDKVANLLIAAALGVSLLAGIAWLIEKRLGDAFDTGGESRQRAILRTLAAMVAERRD